MTDDKEHSVRTFGAPSMTEEGIDVYAFHLHRYLAEWLEEGELDRMYVTVGFEHAACQAVTFEVRAGRSEVAEVGWDFDDLCHAYRSGDGRIRIEQRSEAAETRTYEVLPILDRPATGGAVRVIMGFLLLPETGSSLPQSVGALQKKVGESLRAARRNGVRMFFDDRESRPIKPVIYELMDHLPEWFGCDHSASMLMTSTLETMALNASKHGRLDVLAERLYMEEPDEEVDRLVGMSVLLGGEEAGVLEQVVGRQLEQPDLPYQIYERGEEGGWRGLMDENGADPAGDFHRLDSRPVEEVYVFVPLKVHDGEETELLGFLCMAYRDGVELSSSGGQMLANLGERLSAMLRYSPLYTLSAQKLWVLRRTRDLVETAMTSEKPADRAREELIEGVSSLIAHQGAVPSFAVGYLDEAESGGRVLQYVHPHGWTHFEDLTLPVDVPDDELAGSGVSALSARVGRPLVLAGGRGEGETQQFKNYLYVDEANQRVVDARNPRGEGFDFEAGWRLLSYYYKPARWRSYATLAYPITFGGEVLGVVTIEVEKETDWVWWTGFGGQLFWEMLADELGTAMSALSA